MPIYEYQCEACDEVFEVFQKVSDPPPEEHACGSRKVKRVMSQTSFVLKGTGWYATDYARKDNGNGKRPESSSRSGETQPSSESSKSEKSGSGETPPSSESSKSEKSGAAAA